MKRFIAILLLFMYSFSVSGAVIQMHFCGNNFKAVSINPEPTDKDCCCPAQKNEKGGAQVKIEKQSCCSETDLTLKIVVDQAVSHNDNFSFLALQTGIVPEIVLPIVEQPILVNTIESTYAANAPPNGNWQQIPLYKLFHALVYYA